MIRSGKTTALKNWINRRNDVCGILTPDIDGKRTFIHYPDNKTLPMISEIENPSDLVIGNFRFLENSFKAVNQWLKEDIDRLSCNWLLLDEVGPLELEGRGLHEAFDFILKRIDRTHINLLIVVREKLVGKVIKQYALKDCRVILKDKLFDL